MPILHDRCSHLPIARVSLLGPAARSERELVQCPRLLSSVPLARCFSCEHYRALDREAEGGQGALLCDAQAERTQTERLSLPRLDVAHVMTRDVVCVRPSLSLDAALVLFLEHRARSLPVVDRDNQLLGMLHEPDLQLAVQSERGADGTVSSVMLPLALTIPESMPITRAAAIMAFEEVSSLVVVSPAGEVVGLLSASDLLFWLARADGYLTRVRRSENP
jgi:CBS domain-containing protein